MSLILCCAILLSLAVYAGAEMARCWPYGDVDRDYELTVIDATKIQRFLAGFGVPDELELALADADGNGDMDILDATCIQRYIAGFEGPYRYRELTDYYVGNYSFHSTAEVTGTHMSMSSRETCYVGVPVTFTADFKWGNKPRVYYLSVDGVKVCEQNVEGGSGCCTITYTFTQEGVYEVDTGVECRYGVTKNSRRNVEVRSLPADGRPVVMGAAFFDQTWMGSGNGLLTVTAAGGKGPYEYRYGVHCVKDPDSDKTEETTAEPTESAESAETVIYTEYSADNTFYIYDSPYISASSYGQVRKIDVTVRDATGAVSDTVTVGYTWYQIYL